MSVIRQSPLADDAAWVALQTSIDPKCSNTAVAGVLRQLRTSGALSVLIEDEYLDQDFTTAYSAFYSTVFKRHTKLCRRLHFFKEDVTAPGTINDVEALASSDRLRAIGARSYLGFVVARPVSHAPLGRVVLGAPPSPNQMRSILLVQASYDAHVLGASLPVRSVAMTQQDARVGACAQAAIWMAGRHFHMRHRGPWFSTVAITDAATKVTDVQLSRSLPAGSDFLTPDNMLRALRAMDREPLIYYADQANRPDLQSPWAISWSQVRPHDVINRYIDSGIPVILGFAALPGEVVGHAVLATGHTLRVLPPATVLPNEPTIAEFCEFFLVHDDQRGSNLRTALRVGTPNSESPHSIAGNLTYLIAALPKKVFMSAEAAEKLSWGTLNTYRQEWPAMRDQLHGASRATGEAFVDAITQGKVLARTYLTYGWRYKSRMLRNKVARDFKSALFYHDLPRFVWVTEFGTFDSLNHLEERDRLIFAHSVIDATASHMWESRSVFHAPGLAVRRYHDDADPFGDFKEGATTIADDAGYFPKVRGVDDYAGF